jgi:hypothetical protein
MGEKDHLHALIKSMHKAEQSYFKKIKEAVGTTNSSLLQIFGVLQNQEEYDEENLLKKLDKDTYREFYAVKKYGLYSEILDVLVYSKARASEALWQITRLITHAMVLKERMLFEDAYRQLQKAKKMSQENEFFHKENEINQQLIEVLHQHNSMTDFTFSESVESLRLNSIQISEKSINAEQYFILSDQLYRKGETLRLTQSEEIKAEMHELYLSPLLSAENKALSKTALVCYHFILYFKFNNYEKNSEKACYHIKELIELQESIKRFTPRGRVVQMGNFIILATKLGKQKESFEMLQRIKDLHEEQKDDFIFISYLSHKGILLLKNADANALEGYIGELENIHQKRIDDMSFSKEIMDIKHMLFCYYFRKQNFKKAFSVASYLDVQYNLHSFKNMKFTEKVLRFLCAIEMNDFELMQAEIRAIRYLIKSLDNVLEVELQIFETLERYSKANNDKAKKIILEQYLTMYANLVSANKYSFLLEGFGFNKWVESKLKNEEFAAFYSMAFTV